MRGSNKMPALERLQCGRELPSSRDQADAPHWLEVQTNPAERRLTPVTALLYVTGSRDDGRSLLSCTSVCGL